MTARDLDHLRELRVALGSPPDVTRVDAVLGERRGAIRMLAQELMVRGFYRCRAGAAPTGTGIMPGPESVCSERVRREPERRRRNSARKRSGTRTADGGALELPRGFWRAVGPRSGPPTEGERRQPRLNLSGHRTEGRQARCQDRKSVV